jgi:hypothetical protein
VSGNFKTRNIVFLLKDISLHGHEMTHKSEISGVEFRAGVKMGK